MRIIEYEKNYLGVKVITNGPGRKIWLAFQKNCKRLPETSPEEKDGKYTRFFLIRKDQYEKLSKEIVRIKNEDPEVEYQLDFFDKGHSDKQFEKWLRGLYDFSGKIKGIKMGEFTITDTTIQEMHSEE